MKDEAEREREHEAIKAALQQAISATKTNIDWLKHFDDRQQRLIANCRAYAKNDPAGVPGHNLMMIIDRMARLLSVGD